ncbi:MAG: hypothetical protein JJT94_17565 [Bernardetiaceae bacterium]|nr:hypothetical protein [Bernardetiaceae bacterium]
MQKLFENQAKTFKITEHKEGNFHYLQLFLIGSIETEDYKEGFLKFLQISIDKDIVYFVFNYLELVHDPPECRAWFVAKYAPMVTKRANKDKVYVSVVESGNLFQQFAAKLITKTLQLAKYPFVVQFYKDLESAKQWLKAQQQN